MDFSRVLHLGLAMATLYAIIALWLVVRAMFRYRRATSFSRSVGAEMDGITYAFTRGMMPSAKESARQHMPTFVGGMLYHFGVFTALANLAGIVFKFQLLPIVALGVRLVILAGLIAGLSLLIKRFTQPKMRIISTPDDYIANGLVDLFLTLSVTVSMSPKLEPYLLIAAILLLVYVPIGKIRHCVFFFFTRVNFGKLFGRRGVLPHTAGQHAEIR